jgi:hypothetical protein
MGVKGCGFFLGGMQSMRLRVDDDGGGWRCILLGDLFSLTKMSVK